MNGFEGTSSQWPIALQDGDLQLRPFRRSDRWEWDGLRDRNVDWLGPWEATLPYTVPGGPMSFGRLVKALNRDGRAGRAFPWAITVLDPGAERAVIVGQLTAAPVQWGSAMSATIGYWIDVNRAGQGITPRAVALAGDYLMQRIGMHRLEINIVPRNAPSHRVVEKLGFRFEGVRKDYLHINGRWEDHDSFALTTEDLVDEPGGLRGRLLG